VYDGTTWSATGSLATARTGHQATPLGAGRVLVTGGDAVTASDGTYDPHSLATAELFDHGTWLPAAPMPGGRTGHRSLATRSGTVLVLGGTGGAFAIAELPDTRVLVAGGTTGLSGPATTAEALIP
jgi:hypothetical protein